MTMFTCRRVLMLGSVLMTLSACSGVLYAPTGFNVDRRPHLVQSDYVQYLAVDSINDRVLDDLVEDYNRFGMDVPSITVTYHPDDRNFGARNARNKADWLKSELRTRNLANVEIDTLPVQHIADAGQILLTYQQVEARVDEECTQLDQIGSAGADIDRSYGFGCSIEQQMAKQIHRPADLLGKGGLSPVPASRTLATLGPYRYGVPNQALGGERASGN